ncbi:TIGR01777 family oxidoreductase [Mucilaginibacter sp. UR6-1]|uniref:TIGR01777 family oxidoreductase n=1 Tax=Mucilaginibacter sp. UR6-1 TaxID=1435643 RepID=UPI001E5E56F7|nr:TIGR01777 family oxidoreductase [Mucilaginibacter sp. UR6-1]MCC8410715.1 TIGR01777 family oxidoreductase [Mucilaginibacter sp. UR6-1]
MKYNKVILAGGSGYLGMILAEHFSKQAHEVVIFSRNPKTAAKNIKMIYWDGHTIGDWATHLNNSDVLINLTGKSVNCRYNERNKAEIFASRLNATRVLGKALKQTNNPPKVWINAASATIYRHAEDRPQDEYTGELGTGFSVDVCKQWEQAFAEQHVPGIRKLALRISVVLGSNGGVANYYLNLARFGLGGIQGSGKQYFSWVHEDDITGSIDFLLDNPTLEGAFNIASPYPIQNNKLMATIRKAVGVPFGLPATKWMLEIGTLLLRTETELILKSRWVLPTRLTEAGYIFKVPDIKQAIEKSI